MKLTSWNTSLRSTSYPPQTISSALQHSQSSYVQSAYEAAEALGKNGVTRLPSWAMTWPCGQLSVIGRSGKFSENIKRYDRVFRCIFGTDTATNKGEGFDNNTSCNDEGYSTNQISALEYVLVVPIESLSETKHLSPVLVSIVEKIISRRKKMTSSWLPFNVDPFLKDELGPSINQILDQAGDGRSIIRNPGASYKESEPSQQDKEVLADFFGTNTRELERICNKKISLGSAVSFFLTIFVVDELQVEKTVPQSTASLLFDLRMPECNSDFTKIKAMKTHLTNSLVRFGAFYFQISRND